MVCFFMYGFSVNRMIKNIDKRGCKELLAILYQNNRESSGIDSICEHLSV